MNYTQSRNPIPTTLSQAPWMSTKMGKVLMLPPTYGLTPILPYAVAQRQRRWHSTNPY